MREKFFLLTFYLRTLAVFFYFFVWVLTFVHGGGYTISVIRDIIELSHNTKGKINQNEGK